MGKESPGQQCLYEIPKEICVSMWLRMHDDVIFKIWNGDVATVDAMCVLFTAL